MNINDATREQLVEVAQIDGTRADYLIEHRRKHGPFRSWDEVQSVPSFEEGMVERMQEAGFTLGGEGSREEPTSAERRRPSRESGPSREARDPSGGEERSGRARAARGSEGAGVSLNRASAEELEGTHMIDGERARRLVKHRDAHGSFTSWEDVKEVSGFDDGLVDRLQEAGFGLGGGSSR